MDWLTIVILIVLGLTPIVCMIATAPEEDLVKQAIKRGRK